MSSILSRLREVRMLLGVLTLGLTACHSLGPNSVPRDRFGYSSALAESWKSQMLLNLVKTRYLDAPIYLEVGQIVSGYTLETGVNLSGQFSPQNLRGDSFAGAGVSGTFTDRPTITYTPLTGEKFLVSFLAPIPPARVLALVQSGYAADFILELTLESLNGLRNRPVSVGSRSQADPEFYRAVALLRELQDANALGVRLEPGSSPPPVTVVFFRQERITAELAARLDECRDLLGLPGDQLSFRLVQSPVRGGPGELSTGTRSLSQVMSALAAGIDIPASHRERKLLPPLGDSAPGETPLLHVHSGDRPARRAFVSVPYQDEWFWIAEDDWRSRRCFTSLLFLFTLADGGGAGTLPTITIPAQ